MRRLELKEVIERTKGENPQYSAALVKLCKSIRAPEQARELTISMLSRILSETGLERTGVETLMGFLSSGEVGLFEQHWEFQVDEEKSYQLSKDEAREILFTDQFEDPETWIIYPNAAKHLCLYFSATDEFATACMEINKGVG